MTTPTTTDPAGRVINILQLAIKTPHQRSFLHFWANGFGLQPDNVVEIYYNLGLFRDLVEDVDRTIRQIPDIRHEQYLKAVDQLRTTIAQPNLQTAWNAHTRVLEMIINGLEFASERLQAHSPEPELPPSELEAIRNQAAELIQKLESSKTIPKRLKLILFDLLHGVQRSIDQYKFRGIRGVREEVFIIFSRIQEHYPDFAQSKDEPEVKGFFALLKKVDKITAALLHVKELIWIVAPLLPAIPTVIQHLLQ